MLIQLELDHNYNNPLHHKPDSHLLHLSINLSRAFNSITLSFHLSTTQVNNSLKFQGYLVGVRLENPVAESLGNDMEPSLWSSCQVFKVTPRLSETADCHLSKHRCRNSSHTQTTKPSFPGVWDPHATLLSSSDLAINLFQFVSVS
ncbi:hypothetical protein VNO77_02173 [Canavalia gladiata]|uniref:Uncharacterized protein n=1 Tax=Canavalia gladiata TaxID=3824 RepID=A0AAN9MUJ0_CANGL